MKHFGVVAGFEPTSYSIRGNVTNYTTQQTYCYYSRLDRVYLR